MQVSPDEYELAENVRHLLMHDNEEDPEDRSVLSHIYLKWAKRMRDEFDEAENNLAAAKWADAVLEWRTRFNDDRAAVKAKMAETTPTAEDVTESEMTADERIVASLLSAPPEYSVTDYQDSLDAAEEANREMLLEVKRLKDVISESEAKLKEISLAVQRGRHIFRYSRECVDEALDLLQPPQTD